MVSSPWSLSEVEGQGLLTITSSGKSASPPESGLVRGGLARSVIIGAPLQPNSAGGYIFCGLAVGFQHTHCTRLPHDKFVIRTDFAGGFPSPRHSRRIHPPTTKRAESSCNWHCWHMVWKDDGAEEPRARRQQEHAGKGAAATEKRRAGKQKRAFSYGEREAIAWRNAHCPNRWMDRPNTPAIGPKDTRLRATGGGLFGCLLSVPSLVDAALRLDGLHKDIVGD